MNEIEMPIDGGSVIKGFVAEKIEMVLADPLGSKERQLASLGDLVRGGQRATVTGRPARTFRQWARDHIAAFR